MMTSMYEPAKAEPTKGNILFDYVSKIRLQNKSATLLLLVCCLIKVFVQNF
jgi:hypothetical protein